MADGVWFRVWSNIWEHEKVDAFGSHLSSLIEDRRQGVMLDQEEGEAFDSLIPMVCTTCVLRLNAHLVSKGSDDGIFKARGNRFLVAAWPEYVSGVIPGLPLDWAGSILLEALVLSGWIERLGGDLSDEYRLKGFQDANYHLLKDRERRRKGPKKQATRAQPKARPKAPPVAVPVEGAGDSPGEGAGDSPEARPTHDRHDRHDRHEGTPTGVPPGAARAPKGQTGETPLKWIAQTWMDVATMFDTRWVRHPKVPAAQIPSAQARWKEVPDKGLWKIAMERAARDGWWAGKERSERTGKFWRANLESFLREKHFHRWVTEAKEDWRSDESAEDLAWSRWLEAVENGEFSREEFDYPGTWPSADEHDARTYDVLEKALREWWREFIWKVQA